jgi:hypothetical protein
MRELPTIEHNGIIYTVDTRLGEIRQQAKPYLQAIDISMIEDGDLQERAEEILYADLFDNLDASMCE